MADERELPRHAAVALDRLVHNARERGETAAAAVFALDTAAEYAADGVLFVRSPDLDAAPIVELAQRLHRSCFDAGFYPRVVVAGAGISGGSAPPLARPDLIALVNAAARARWMCASSLCQIATRPAVLVAVARRLAVFGCGLLDLGAGRIVLDELPGALERRWREGDRAGVKRGLAAAAEEDLLLWRELLGDRTADDGDVPG